MPEVVFTMNEDNPVDYTSAAEVVSLAIVLLNGIDCGRCGRVIFLGAAVHPRERI